MALLLAHNAQHSRFIGHISTKCVVLLLAINVEQVIV